MVPTYEWVADDKQGDKDAIFSDKFSEVINLSKGGEELYNIALVKTQWKKIPSEASKKTGLTNMVREYAYLISCLHKKYLPFKFPDGSKIPKKYFKEVDNFFKNATPKLKNKIILK